MKKENRKNKRNRVSNNLLVILIIIFGTVMSINNLMIYREVEELALKSITSLVVSDLSLCINSRPVINGTCDDSTFGVGGQYFCDADANDTDSNQNLTFFLDKALFEINSSTGIINFTANLSQTGVNVINLSVADNSSCVNNISSSLFTLTITSVNITTPGQDDIIRPNETIPFRINIGGSELITNVSVVIFNETFVARNSSTSLFNFTYTAINLPPKIVNATAYGYNETAGPGTNFTDEIQLRIARPAGETSSPAISFTCSNETYAFNKTNISIITIFDLDTLLEQSNVSILMPNISIQFPVQRINSSNDTTYLHSINYTYVTSNLPGHHTITAFVKDIENQTIELNATLHVSNVSKQINVTILNTELPKLKDVCTGNLLFNATSFTLPNISYYDTEIDYQSDIRAIFFNSSFSSTVNATFNFTQLTNETDVPSGQRRVDMFDLFANIQHNNFTLTYNYSSTAHTITTENNLDIYSCNTTVCNSSTWDNLDVNVSTDTNILTAVGLKNISRRFVVTEESEVPAAPVIFNLTVASGIITKNTLQNISLTFNVSGTLSSVTLTVNGTLVTVNKTATVDKKYYYNYTYKPSAETNYTVSASVTDTNDQKTNKDLIFFSAPEETFNLSTLETLNITLIDTITGETIVFAQKVNISLPRGKYIIKTKANDNKTDITIVNATLNTSVGIGLIYNDIGEILTAPSNTTNLDQFEVNSSLAFVEVQFVYNYTNLLESITHEDNLEVHKCDSTSNCTFSEISATIDENKNTISFTSNNLSVFDIVESTVVTTETVTEETTTTVTVAGPSVGGGSFTTRVASLELIAPSPVSLSLEDSVILPIIIRNTGQIKLKDINLTFEANTSGILIEADDVYFEEIETNDEASTNIRLNTNLEEYGFYEITVTATGKTSGTVGETKVGATAKIIINTIGIEVLNKTIIKTKVVFAKGLFEQNPECLELMELLDQADIALEEGQDRKATALAESAINACRDLIASIEKYIEAPIPKPVPLTIGEIATRVSVVIALLVTIGMIIYRVILGPKLKRKGPRPYKPKKAKKPWGFSFKRKKPKAKRKKEPETEARGETKKELEQLLKR